ncbi:MAG: TonB-dependent receptor, partial [Gemmatimonadota bacterium]|nr:TonB-dependent receptor [Gemmatimonadota bacterium]
ASQLHRSYRFPNPSAASVRSGRGFDNPFFVINDETATSSLSRVFGNIDLDYQPAEWLTFKYTGGGDYYSDERLEAFPLTNSTLPSGSLNRANFVNYVLDHNLLAIAQKTFTPSFASSITVGQNLNSTRFRQLYVTGTTLLAPEPFKLTNAVTIVPNDFEQNVHRESYFGQLTFDLFQQFYLTGAVRQDGSSAFAQNNRRHWYPKASAAWTFSDALHGRWADKLDFAKARVAYGVTGKEPNPYSTIPAFGVSLFCDYGGIFCNRTVFQGQGGLLSPTVRPNGNLKPERTREAEYGLDFGFFRGFADLSLTYYDSKSDDVIFPLPLPPSSGYTQQIQNAAVITNKGTEVTLNLHPLRRTSLGWDVSLLWSKNKNRVQSITGAEEVVVGSGNFGQSVAKPGYPVGAIEEFDFARCRYGEPNVVNGVDINAFCTAHKAPQGALYIDDGSVGQAGFPFVDYTSRIVGSWEPKWQGSIRNAFRFGKIQVSGLLDIKKGGQAWDGTRGALYAYGTHKDTDIRGGTFVFGPTTGGVKGYYTSAVTGPGAGTSVVIDQGWFQDLGGAFGDNGAQFVEDAGYVKLREISVAYTLDRAFVKRLFGLSSIDLRVAGRNLKTWTNYQGIDPESNLAGASGFIQGFDWFNNPQTRSVVLSVGLNR